MKIPLDSIEMSAFQRRVYEAALQIPRGRVTTYRWLGLSIACHSPRAIGQALRRNPLAPDVPCHRIVASNLAIGGFAGQISGPAITRKLRLLQAEGVLFRNGRLADRAQVYTFGLQAADR